MHGLEAVKERSDPGLLSCDSRLEKCIHIVRHFRKSHAIGIRGKKEEAAVTGSLSVNMGRWAGCLPDQAGVRADHFLRGLAAKCLGELGHVRHRAVDAPAGQRVGIAGDLLAFGLGRVFAGPNLSPAEEETLFGRKTIDILRTRLTLERLQIGVIRDRQAGEITDILTKRKGSLNVESRLHFVAVELVDDTFGPLVEFGRILRRPPRF